MSSVPDKLLISGIDCIAAIGVTPEERTIRQRLSIDVELSTDTSKPAGHDSLKEAIDYSKVVKMIVEVCRSREFHLIETVAERIARELLSTLPVRAVRIVVRKLTPVLEHRVNHVAVEIIRTRS